MRIIAGTAGGRRLVGPPSGAATRPTSDKVREAMFNIVANRIDGARVLDLFAGTGAIGLEALSRGASHVTWVESDRSLCDIIRKNLATTQLTGETQILTRDVRKIGGFLREKTRFDLVFIDPPYGHGLELEALVTLLDHNLLADDAMVIVEHASRETLALPASHAQRLTEVRTKHYGDTALTCYSAHQSERHVVLDGDTEEGSASMPRTAIYPGSFDPLTKGHHDVIQRSLVLFDRLVIAVASNVRKQPLFTVEERISLVREVVGDDPRIEIDTFEGLLVDYAKRKGAVAIVRGLRAVADFEFEFEMATMNRRLAPNVETVFLMTHESYFYVSSHLVKEVAMLGGEFDAFVPPAVAAKLKLRLAELGRK